VTSTPTGPFLGGIRFYFKLGSSYIMTYSDEASRRWIQHHLWVVQHCFAENFLLWISLSIHRSWKSGTPPPHIYFVFPLLPTIVWARRNRTENYLVVKEALAGPTNKTFDTIFRFIDGALYRSTEALKIALQGVLITMYPRPLVICPSSQMRRSNTLRILYP